MGGQVLEWVKWYIDECRMKKKMCGLAWEMAKLMNEALIITLR